MNSFQKQLNELRHRHQLVALMVFTLVAVLAWTAASLFSSQKKTKLPTNLTVLAQPLVPTITTEVLTKLQQKRQFNDDELRSFTIFTLKPEEERRSRVSSPSAQPQTAPEESKALPPESTPEPVFSNPSLDQGNENE